jgi:hypothetical protein
MGNIYQKLLAKCKFLDYSLELINKIYFWIVRINSNEKTSNQYPPGIINLT